MSVTFPEIGNKVMTKVIGMQNNCTIGMKVGDEFELSVHKCGDFCGYFYHNLFNWVTTLQFGGHSRSLRIPISRSGIARTPTTGSRLN